MKLLYVITGKEARLYIMEKFAAKRKALLLPLAVLSVVLVADAGWRPPKPGGGGHGVPEPASIVLLGGGLAALGIYAKRKKNKK